MAVFDPEKHPEKVSAQSSETASEAEQVDLGTYAKEELLDPEARGEDTLHRGLSARQISMIAVRTSWFYSHTTVRMCY